MSYIGQNFSGHKSLISRVSWGHFKARSIPTVPQSCHILDPRALTVQSRWPLPLSKAFITLAPALFAGNGVQGLALRNL